MTNGADRVEFTDDAIDELNELVAYIAERDPGAAEKVRSEVFAAVLRLAERMPRLDGSAVMLRSGAGSRRWFVHPVMLFYEREEGVLRVLRVHHHAREPIER